MFRHRNLREIVVREVVDCCNNIPYKESKGCQGLWQLHVCSSRVSAVRMNTHTPWEKNVQV